MDKFFSDLQKKPASPDAVSERQRKDGDAVDLPKGVVLGEDGKPCRSCTSSTAWLQMMKNSTRSPSAAPRKIPQQQQQQLFRQEEEPTTLPSDCPPDVEALGRSTWTFLHTMSAAYPPSPSKTQQSDMSQFLSLFSKLYPCWHCAEDFRDWMRRPGNEPRIEGREGLGRWMCEAHNEVNRKLGKKEFDCGKVGERWGPEGPGDGRCG